MATFAAADDAVVVRILYDGLGTAGKTSSLRKIREIFAQRSGEIHVPEEHDGRTLYFDWLDVRAGRFGDHALRVELMTVPGQWAYGHRRFALLQTADAVIGVLDGTDPGVRRATYALSFLRRVRARLGASAPPVVFQAHKQDLPGARGVGDLRAALGIAEEEPMLATSAVTGDGLRETFVLALRSARRHVTRLLAGRSPATLPPAGETPAALYERMRAEELDEAEREGALVVDEVLDEVDGRS